MMEINQFGDSALLINFEQKIDLKVNSKVHQLENKIKNTEGVSYIIPAYCSLTVVYDAAVTSFEKLKTEIQRISLKDNESPPKRKLKIPVCYSKTYGLDLNLVEEETNLSTEEIIKIHTKNKYRVFMMGFIPGFPYMGVLHKKLIVKRLSTPRSSVPMGSVGIANNQTGIYPSKTPGGWKIIGRTPIPLFIKNDELEFLFQNNDEVSFYPIKLDEFDQIIDEIKQGQFNFEQIYE